MSQLYRRFYTSLILLGIISLSFNNLNILIILLILISILALIEFNFIFKKIYHKAKLFYFLSIILSLSYLVFFSLNIMNFMFAFENIQKISIIFLILICVLTDIGGFIFGKIIGGKKFTKISPNKTYSGIVGSFLLSITLGYYFYYYLNDYIILKENILIFIFLISLISQSGDLCISFLKRKAKIKDTGSILPGHGGILDRIDGILIALPTGLILFAL